jgi:hypothetical protein
VFTQDGDEFILSVPVLDIDTSSLGTSAALQTLTSAPSGVKVLAIMNIYTQNNSAGVSVYLSSPDASDQAPSRTVSPLGAFQLIEFDAFGADYMASQLYLRIRTDTSRRIRARSTAASTTLRIATLGWVDSRGRNA